MKRSSFFLLVLTACRWETDLPDDAKAIPVDPARELVITDLGALGENASRAPLSFAHATDALHLDTGAWLAAWSARLPSERAQRFDEVVTCRWLRAEPTNGCNATCTQCGARTFPLSRAPFRTTAVVNRTDLSVMPDRVADGGEARLVFTLTDGPADDPASRPLPLAVIYEYAQVGDAKTWSARWHALGKGRDGLVALTERFVGAGTLAQVRTADAATGEALLLHEMAPRDGALAFRNVRNTPIWSTVPRDALEAWSEDNAEAIADGTAVMPKTWWAPAASSADVAPGFVPAPVVKATCTGCHAESKTGFHVGPDGTLSSFLTETELRRRAAWMQLTLTR